MLIDGPGAETQSETRVTFCRCVASSNKPYCDGSHSAASFKASGEPSTVTSEPLASRDGKITLRPLPNGPVLLDGNLEICSGTGRTINRLTKGALCRCGASENKPFCDGSHSRVGFES
jgi:CDGSH-type Zn-finger protein